MQHIVIYSVNRTYAGAERFAVLPVFLNQDSCDYICLELLSQIYMTV